LKITTTKTQEEKPCSISAITCYAVSFFSTWVCLNKIYAIYKIKSEKLFIYIQTNALSNCNICNCNVINSDIKKCIKRLVIHIGRNKQIKSIPSYKFLTKMLQKIPFSFFLILSKILLNGLMFSSEVIF